MISLYPVKFPNPNCDRFKFKTKSSATVEIARVGGRTLRSFKVTDVSNNYENYVLIGSPENGPGKFIAMVTIHFGSNPTWRTAAKIHS